MRQTDCVPINGDCGTFERGPVTDLVSQPTNGTSGGEVGKNTSFECSSHLPPIPNGLEPLKHQLAGHKFGDKNNSDLYGMLDCKDGTILKPVMLKSRKGEREKYFYELVNGMPSVNQYFGESLYEAEQLRKLSTFTPTFKGFVSLPEHPNVLYIKMVDATVGFIKPHLIDVKIGAKAWEPKATLEKIHRQKSRCPYLDQICFQVLGAQYYDAQTGEAIVKHNLRKYTPHDLLHSGFYDIFNGLPEHARGVILEQIINGLREIADWFGAQSLLSFHGSSVLIVFEGDEKFLASLGDKIESSSDVVHIKMIDFMHVWETTGVDNNYLEGVNNLIYYLSSLTKLYKKSVNNV